MSYTALTREQKLCNRIDRAHKSDSTVVDEAIKDKLPDSWIEQRRARIRQRLARLKRLLAEERTMLLPL